MNDSRSRYARQGQKKCFMERSSGNVVYHYLIFFFVSDIVGKPANSVLRCVSQDDNRAVIAGSLIPIGEERTRPGECDGGGQRAGQNFSCGSFKGESQAPSFVRCIERSRGSPETRVYASRVAFLRGKASARIKRKRDRTPHSVPGNCFC